MSDMAQQRSGDSKSAVTTPGGVGVTQAANSVALRDYTDARTATAYSLSQQLITSATNVLYALARVLAVFGWTGGKALVESSYSGAKDKVQKKKPDDGTSGGGESQSGE